MASWTFRLSPGRLPAMSRFVLYGSPHSPFTYKVALMLQLCGEPFSFRYISFQRGMQKTPEFRALSRWGQVPVLTDAGSSYVAACKRILADVTEAERAASGEFSAPTGELVVTAPVALGRIRLVPILAVGGLALGLMASRSDADDQAPAE